MHKILNKEKDEKEVNYIECNEYENHKESIKVKISSGNVTEEEINKLAYQLILNYINQPLSFHLDNLKNNKINWKKTK